MYLSNIFVSILIQDMELDLEIYETGKTFLLYTYSI